MSKLLIKTWALVVILASNGSLWASAVADEAPLCEFQNARQKVRAGQDIFHAQMTHASFGDALMHVHDLLKHMHAVNEWEAQRIPGEKLKQAMADAQAWQEMGLMRVKEEQCQGLLDARYGLDRVSNLNAAASLRVQACQYHGSIANGRPKLFAGQNLAQVYLDKRINLLRERHHDVCLEILWNAFEEFVHANAHGSEVLLRLRMIKKPLGELLLKTKGDVGHPAWGENAKTLKNLIQTCFRSQQLVSLLQNYVPVLAYNYGLIHAREENKNAARSFALYDDYGKSYDIIAKFYWFMEKSLVDAAIQDAQRRVTQDQDSLYIALANVWSPNVSYAAQRPRDLIMELLRGVMIRRFALTQLSWEKAQLPAPLC